MVLVEVKGEPSPAEIQSEFYYLHFSSVPSHLWFAACQLQATGDHWPSVDALKQTIRELTPAPLAKPNVWGPEFITKDEFGQNLLETIKTISGIHTLLKQHAAAVHDEKPSRRKDVEARVQEVKGFLANQLPTLTDDEMAQILERYPDVVTL
jgi:hypothetical protein